MPGGEGRSNGELAGQDQRAAYFGILSCFAGAVAVHELQAFLLRWEPGAAAYGANHATSALFGPAPGLDTVAGFTAFKVSMSLMVLGGVWGLLTATRLLRGEEDAGRWELLLAGRKERRAP